MHETSQQFSPGLDSFGTSGKFGTRKRQLAMLHCFLLLATRPEWPPSMALVYPGGQPSSFPFSTAGSDESRR